MNREDRLSAGMKPEKVEKIYEVLKKRYEQTRKKIKEASEKIRQVTEDNSDLRG